MTFKVFIVKANKLIIPGNLWLDDAVTLFYIIRAYIFFLLYNSLYDHMVKVRNWSFADILPIKKVDCEHKVSPSIIFASNPKVPWLNLLEM